MSPSTVNIELQVEEQDKLTQPVEEPHVAMPKEMQTSIPEKVSDAVGEEFPEPDFQLEPLSAQLNALMIDIPSSADNKAIQVAQGKLIDNLEEENKKLKCTEKDARVAIGQVQQAVKETPANKIEQIRDYWLNMQIDKNTGEDSNSFEIQKMIEQAKTGKADLKITELKK